MKQILQLVNKDFRRLRSRLALWVMCLAAKYFVGACLIWWGTLDSASFGVLQGALVALVGADIALTLLLTVFLVQEDSVVGTTAFWLTRPISRSRMLAAKVLGAFSFLVVPAVVVAVPWWLLCGFDASQVAAAALDVALFQIALIGLAFAAATLTPSLERSFAGLLVVGGATLVALSLVALGSRQPERVESSRLALQVALVVAAIGVSVPLQYLRRNTRASLSVLGLGLLLATAGMQAWRWDILPAQQPVRIASEIDPQRATTVAIDYRFSRILQVGQGRSPQQPPVEIVAMNFESRGVPDGYALAQGSLNFAWSWPEKPDYAGVTNSWVNPLGSWATRGLFGIRSAPKPVPSSSRRLRPDSYTVPPPTDKLMATARVTPAVGAELRNSPVFKAQWRGELVRPEVRFETPVGARKWQAARGHGLRIIEVSQNENESVAQVLESTPVVFFQELAASMKLAPRIRPDFEYVFVSRKHGELAPFRGSILATVHLGGVRISRREIDVSGPRAANGKAG